MRKKSNVCAVFWWNMWAEASRTGFCHIL